jgi:tetraacyldisaccharide 4'-kinase
MNLFRKLLFPFAVIYDIITSIRNFFFDIGRLKSYQFDLPVIAVGNLSVGGTGKTPQIEYLIRLLQNDYRVATLSRGYKRKSTGFILADDTSNSAILGDEPYQFYKKFANVQVAVDADRKNGITQLLKKEPRPEIILLDDAYQHRKVQAGLYILLTAYNDLYADDFILPMGNLRESKAGAKRATIIIVTKCPTSLSYGDQETIKTKLKLNPNQELYFTSIAYDDCIYSKNGKLAVSSIRQTDKLLVAGIAKPEPFFAYLQAANDTTMVFSDHHDFTDQEIAAIKKKSKNKIIITTEKDYVRLKDSAIATQLYYLPIKSSFLNGEDQFNKTILNYVGTSTRNS